MDLPAGARRRDLDWMRLAAALAAYLLTAMRLFGTWPAVDLPASRTVAGAAGVLDLVAPLSLLVSGGAISCALDRHGPASFAVSKVLRLLVPFVASILALEVSGAGDAGGAFGLRLMYPWYLLALFAGSLVLLPLFLALRAPGVRARVARLSLSPVVPAVLLAAGAFPAIANSFPFPGSPLGAPALGGWAPGFYPVMLALGFFTFSQPGIRTQAARHSPWLLALGAALCAGLLVPWTEPPAAAVAPLRACAAWTLCLGILGLGIRLLGGARPLPAGLNERVLPLYLLGLPAILACGRLFARWDAPDALKLPSLCITGLLVIAGLTEVALRVNVLRFLCGLKPLSRPQKKGASYSANGGNGK